MNKPKAFRVQLTLVNLQIFVLYHTFLRYDVSDFQEPIVCSVYTGLELGLEDPPALCWDFDTIVLPLSFQKKAVGADLSGNSKHSKNFEGWSGEGPRGVES